MATWKDGLVPPLDWVDDPDPGSENYDLSCPVCSALVENRTVHRAWHLALSERIEAVSEKAGRYVPPPTYYGHSLDELAAQFGGSDG